MLNGSVLAICTLNGDHGFEQYTPFELGLLPSGTYHVDFIVNNETESPTALEVETSRLPGNGPAFPSRSGRATSFFSKHSDVPSIVILPFICFIRISLKVRATTDNPPRPRKCRSHDPLRGSTRSIGLLRTPPIKRSAGREETGSF